MHDNDGPNHCADCGKHLLLDRLKFEVVTEIAWLEDLLHDIRAGMIANAKSAGGASRHTPPGVSKLAFPL